MAKPDIPIEATQELKRGNLTTIDAVAMAIAVLSPAMAMAYNTTFGASFAGTSNPLAFLLGGIACLTLAWVVIGFTRRMASAGYAYTYVSRSIGPSFGFLSGWLYFFGFLCFVPMTMAGVGGYTSQLLKSETGLNLHWFIIFLIGMALLVLLAIYDVKIGTRTQLALAAVTVAVIVVFDLIVTRKAGCTATRLRLSPLATPCTVVSRECSTASSLPSPRTSVSKPRRCWEKRRATRAARFRSRL
jgi:amino acid transporter